MKPTQNFFDLVQAFEGLQLIAYKDIAGIWTIGYGTTHYPDGSPVKEGDICTLEQAENWLCYHTGMTILPLGLSESQADSLFDFCYNVGQHAFNGSSLKKDIAAGADADTITADFCMWDKSHVDGKLIEVGGLLRRRKCEAYLFNNGVNHPTFFE